MAFNIWRFSAPQTFYPLAGRLIPLEIEIGHGVPPMPGSTAGSTAGSSATDTATNGATKSATTGGKAR